MNATNDLNTSALNEQTSGFDTKKYIARKERQAEMRDQRLGVDVGTTASQRILDKAFMNTPLRVNLGMEARPSQGMLGELGAGIARGTFTTVRGVANTLEELTGNDGPGTMSYGMDRWARTHQGTFVGQPAYEGITDWSAGMIGEQVPFMASLLISGGTTGAIAKGMQLGMGAAKTLTTAGAMATVSAIQYGDNVDGIRKAANGKLSESQIHAMGALSTVVQSALEVALGPDAKILDATVMNAVRKSARPAAEMIALTAGGKGLFKSARNYFGSIAAESFTEFSQSITQSIFEDMSAGPGTQMSKEDFAEAFQAALAAVPSSALFGGFGMHAQWRERQKMLDVLKGLENDKSAIDLRAKTEEEKLARQQRTNAAFDTFKGKLSEKFGETGAEAITATVEVAAYHWAVERGLNPEDYINTFGMLFSNTTLSQQQQIELKKIESEEGRIQWMRNNVQGYREFEASEKDGYVADAFEKQFAVELDEYSALFGRGVFEGLLNEIGTAQDESIEANKNRETAPTPQEMTDQAAKRRADAVLNLYNLRQLALDAVADTKMEGDHIKLASLTRQSSSDMFKAIINPGENTSWIKPENMRRTLANLIYINNDNISREDAHATVQKLSTTKREGMKYSELEAYFLYEAGIDEMNNNDGTMFSSDEIVEALRVIKDNEDAWNKVVSQELGEYSYQAMLDAADAAGASAAQKARIVINHARNMRQRSLENAAEIWKMRDASEIKMSEDDAVAVSEFESEARKIDDLISKIEQAILEKANINTILEIANIKTIPRLTEELDRAVTDLFAMNYKIEEGAVRALRATEQEKADSISAAQEARLVINRSLNIPKKSSFLIQELNKLRDNSTTPLSEEETEAISVIESVSSKLSALISETEKAIREDGDAETILSLSAKVKRAESDLSVKNGMFETHIVQVMKDVADKEIRNAADAEGASVVQKALLALNHAFNMSYKGQVKLTSEQAREWKRAKKSTVDLVGKPRKNTKPTVDGRTDVNEINVYTENLLNRISDLSADLRESMQRAENNIEIAKLTDELNEAISELSGYVSVVEEGLASELKQAMGFDPNKQAPLRSEAETKVYAEYNIKKKIAVFYANATAEDVIHEWFHHVDTNNLLPEKLRDAMNEKYGINTDSSSTEIRNAREKAARDFVKYIAHVSGKDMDYPEELEEAFAYLREVFAAGLHAEQGFDVNEDGNVFASEGMNANENELFVRGGPVSEEESRLLEDGEKIKLYRAMQLIDGKLYPPMSAVIEGKLRSPTEIGVWERSQERPDLVDDKGRFKLNKGNKATVPARYNPYFHASESPLNDQFSSAYKRPNLVTVEVEVPVSELTSGYRSYKAKDTVGAVKWNAGPVTKQLKGTTGREVVLSRWNKVIRVVPDSEVASIIAESIRDQNVTIPENVVTPSLKAELEKLGVRVLQNKKREDVSDGNSLYSNNSINYKPEVREFFKGLLDGVTGPDWRQEMMAKIIARSMENDPPQTTEYEPPLQSSNMMNVTDLNSLRNAAHKMNKGGAAKGDGKTTHGKFFEDAYKKITGKDYEQGGWENLSLPNKQLLAQMAVNAYQETHQSYTMEELDAAAQAFNVERFADLDEKTKKQIRNSFESHRRAATSKNLDDVAKTFHMDAIRKAANNALGEFIPEARAIARLNPEIRRRERGERGGEVGWMDSFGSGVSSGYKKFEAWVKAKTFDFYAMVDYLDDGKKDGPVKRLLLDPLSKGVQKWAEARHETDKWLIEAGETHGAMPEVNDWKKEYYFGTEKKKLSVRQALFIYMYTDKGRAKDETKTLFESNKVKLGNDIDSVMTDVIQLVEGWGFGKDKGFVRWVQKKGVNDYRHSLKEREGWTKTYPLRNYARAQMDYMKRIYPELNRVHLERTGRELGNLFKGKDGKTREFIAPSMRMGQSWAHGKGLTDLFVANEEERTALVREVYGKKYGTDVTFDKLSDEEQKAIYALEEDLHVEESGISKRRTNARSQLVGSLESRTKGFTESEILMDAPFIFERYRDQANIYRTKYNIIDYLDAITRHGEFRETIRALVGDDRLDRIHNAIREMITRERFSGGRNYVDDDFDRLVSDVQGRVLPAVLMGRISTQAMQLTSAPRALAELPFRDHLKFFSNSLKIMGQLGTNIGRIGDVISMRHNPFFGDTEVGQWMQHMLESNPEILTRMYDPNVADYYESGQQRTGAGAIKVGRSNLADVALSGLRWMDMAAVLLVYQTCYESKVAELKRSRNQMTDAQIEKAAVDHAAHVVQITQIASTTTDRNLIQTARPTVRMWFPFTGDLMKQFTYINRQIVAPLARGWRDGKFEGVLQAMFVPGNQYGNQPAFKRILYFGLLPMTMVSLIKRRRPPESWEEWREDMLGLSVSTIPLIGPIFQNAITSNYQIDGTPIAMMPVMSLSKALRSLGKDGLIGEDGYVNEYGLEELGRAVLSGNGLPVVFVPFASEFCKMMLGSDAFTPEEKTIIERVLRVLSLSQAPTSAEK